MSFGVEEENDTPEPQPNVLHYQSGVNGKGEPFVQLLLDMRVVAQMTTGRARDHARGMLEAAEAAEQDAFLFDWVTTRVGGGPEQTAGLLADFRRCWLARTGKRGGPGNPRDRVMPGGEPRG